MPNNSGAFILAVFYFRFIEERSDTNRHCGIFNALGAYLGSRLRLYDIHLHLLLFVIEANDLNELVIHYLFARLQPPYVGVKVEEETNVAEENSLIARQNDCLLSIEK